ncbi:hypothetical protein ACFSTC_58470 [Nonomuraea ferruginea]
MVRVAVLRLLAVGLISGGVMTIPFLWAQRGSDFEHVRLSALIGLNLGQLVTVPLGLLIGIVLVAMRSWTRPPGYVLAAATIVFGVVVATQAWAMADWAEGRPAGIGDPDGEVGLGGAERSRGWVHGPPGRLHRLDSVVWLGAGGGFGASDVRT